MCRQLEGRASLDGQLGPVTSLMHVGTWTTLVYKVRLLKDQACESCTCSAARNLRYLRYLGTATHSTYNENDCCTTSHHNQTPESKNKMTITLER